MAPVSGPQRRARRAGARRIPRAQREQQMLDVASRVFAARDFDDATMDDIASQVGVTKPMLYAYFSSKDGIFLACAERATNRLIEALEQAVAEPGPLDVRVWRGLLACFGWMEDNRHEAELLLLRRGPRSNAEEPLWIGGLRHRIAGVHERVMAELALEHGAGGQALGFTPAFARAFAAVTESFAERWLRDPREPKELQALLIMNFAWQGMGAMIRGDLWTPPVESRPA